MRISGFVRRLRVVALRRQMASDVGRERLITVDDTAFEGQADVGQNRFTEGSVANMYLFSPIQVKILKDGQVGDIR